MDRPMASIGEMRNAYRILVGKTYRKRPFADLGLDGRLMKRILEK
jgi:hypothetical protein